MYTETDLEAQAETTVSKFNVLIATELTEESLQLLKNAKDVTVNIVTPSVQAVREGLKSAHVLIARDDVQIDAEMIEHAPELKIIAHPSASVRGIDVEMATERGIIVMNTPGVSAVAAGEHTLALMLALSRRLVDAHNSMRSGYWLMDRKQQAGTQLSGKILGLIGLGRVGNVVAQRALAFGMTVLAFDPYLSEEQIGDKRIQLIGLRELLERSDFVSLHVAATAETQGLLNAERIKQMKPGARLINTSHGAAVDEQAVMDALKEGHLSGVAIDVYKDEPPYNSPLVGMQGVIHTPHIGDNTVEATQDLSTRVVEQVLDALHDIDYRNAINMPFMPGVDFETIRPYLTLAERIGTIMHVLTRHPVRRIAVEYRGEDVSTLVKPLTVALLKGILSPVLGSRVSYINAPLLASERGMQVTQVKGLTTETFTNIVSVQVTLEDGEEIKMSGTLLDRKVPHIIQINEYRMDFVPKGHLLIIGSYDKPGVIGQVGTLMATNNVNIASWLTGRAQPGGNTLTVIAVDSEIPDTLMDELRTLEFIRHAHQVKL